MRLIRLRIATALLSGAGFVAGVIAGPDLRNQPRPDISLAGRVLLTSLVGLAICFFWIWINARAWR